MSEQEDTIVLKARLRQAEAELAAARTELAKARDREQLDVEQQKLMDELVETRRERARLTGDIIKQRRALQTLVVKIKEEARRDVGAARLEAKKLAEAAKTASNLVSGMLSTGDVKAIDEQLQEQMGALLHELAGRLQVRSDKLDGLPGSRLYEEAELDRKAEAERQAEEAKKAEIAAEAIKALAQEQADDSVVSNSD